MAIWGILLIFNSFFRLFFFKKTEFLIKYSFSKIFLQNGDFGGFLLIFNSFFGLFFFKNKRIFYKIYSFLKNISHKMASFGDFGPNFFIFIWQFIFKNREFVIEFLNKKINGLEF
jgi:hypothetical protein